jgi:hypothetical protein
MKMHWMIKTTEKKSLQADINVLQKWWSEQYMDLNIQKKCYFFYL